MYRIGQGFDIHRLVEGRKLILGGVEIPYEKGLLGHSDADALVHAIIDALFGALALGDIGTHFPDNDPKYKNIDSLELLKIANSIIKNNGYSINNIDSSIIAQEPKMKPYIEQMRQKLAQILDIDEKLISIKAKTMEGQDSVGEKKAISVQSVILLKKN
ncbi:2-C-methyl-D-erythritol 2,4-cyclodiphosphate synthase [bacterium]|nr:2-C-methyl-D-erythritol 2,4-cyclodiphosphate synthase [bacterium]